jgi:hypothetical protein
LINPYLISIIAGITTPPEAARVGIIPCPSENAKEVFLLIVSNLLKFANRASTEILKHRMVISRKLDR